MASLLQAAFDKQTLLSCEGYDPAFIDATTKLNITSVVPKAYKGHLPQVEGNTKGILNYTNLSVLYNTARKVPFVSAYNINGTQKEKVSRTFFRPDPRIDASLQLSQEGFYDLRTDLTEFEIGHMAANNEMAWGNKAQLQAYQTFHFTNSVPQAENLNTGIWKTLETYIIEEAIDMKRNKKICVFTGPVLRKDDPVYVKDRSFQIPLLFYKVIVFPTSKGLYATGFLMSHEQRMVELEMLETKPVRRGLGYVKLTVDESFTDFKYKKVFQVNIKLVEEQTGLKFRWKGVKHIKVPNDKMQLEKIRKIRDSKDAADANKGIRTSSTFRETAAKPAGKTYKLNMILP